MTLKPQTGSAGGTSTLAPLNDTRELVICGYSYWSDPTFPVGFTTENDICHCFQISTLLRSWSASHSLRERFADHSLRPKTSGTTCRCSSTPSRTPSRYARDRDRSQLEDLARAPKGVYNNIVTACKVAHLLMRSPPRDKDLKNISGSK